MPRCPRGRDAARGRGNPLTSSAVPVADCGGASIGGTLGTSLGGEQQ